MSEVVPPVLRAVLERAQQHGVLGPGPIEQTVAHAMGFSDPAGVSYLIARRFPLASSIRGSSGLIWGGIDSPDGLNRGMTIAGVRCWLRLNPSRSSPLFVFSR